MPSKLHIKTNSNATKCITSLDHVWTNVVGNGLKARTTKAYWADYHEPIYFAFTLPNHIYMCMIDLAYNYYFI